MKLSQLVAHAEGVSSVRESDPAISSVTDDSRQVLPGSLFVARRGSTGDGSQFIADAVARGAVAIGIEDGVPTSQWPGRELAIITMSNPRRQAVQLAHALHGHPAKSMRIVGVTGTNGKTTIAFLIQHILSSSEVKCGLLGTVLTDDGNSRVPSELTTPGGCELARTLSRMVANGCQAVAMEVSSQALHQGRVDGIDFSVAVFTNLTGDHLDYHKSMDCYADAKAMLFASLANGAVAIVNCDDPAYTRMLEGCAGRHLKCSGKDRSADCFVEVARVSLGSMSLTLTGPWGVIEVSMGVVGAHNAMNALEAAAAAWSLGVPREAIAQGLASATAPPGRLEPVTPRDAPFAVLVDYAHTDDALMNVLRSVREVVKGGRVIAVFGCGGDRDRTKRPRMGGTAVALADHVIVTSDNPRTEDAESIIDEIFRGIPDTRAGSVERVVDRAEAIARAVAIAQTGDLVLIAGKGHEDYQIIGKEKRHFDDREIARLALESRCGAFA